MSTGKKEHRVLFLGFSPSDYGRIERIIKEKRPGAEVSFISSLEAGPGVVDKEEILAVCINHSPGDWDAFTVVNELRAMEILVPTVLITATDDEETVRKAYEAGFYECVDRDDGCFDSLPTVLNRALARDKYKKITRATSWAISQSRKEWITIIDAITDFIFITDDHEMAVKPTA